MTKTNGQETVIAQGVRVEGDFKSQGDVIIEGEVAGNIQAAGDLRVGEQSKIKADVIAGNAVVSGEIRGNMQIAGRLELTQSAQIIGDVTVEVLSVAPGAQVNGKITMDGRKIETDVKEEK